MNGNTIDLTDLLMALIALFAAIVTRYVVPWIKSHTSVSQYHAIYEATKVAVEAAEQLYKNGTLKSDERKNYVNSILQSHGFNVDYNQLESMIESCVRALPKSSNTVQSITKNDETLRGNSFRRE